MNNLKKFEEFINESLVDDKIIGVIYTGYLDKSYDSDSEYEFEEEEEEDDFDIDEEKQKDNKISSAVLSYLKSEEPNKIGDSTYIMELEKKLKKYWLG